MTTDRTEKRLAELLPQLIAIRRDLHAHPEVGFQEQRTAAKIAEWLERLPGMQVRRGVAETGIMATLAAGKPGPCLAFRADMDALPMEDRCGKPHASTHPGVAHACGHDGHVACLLGAATLMAEFPGELAGPVRFIFQPAEEGGGGAKFMCEQGALDDPRPVAIFGLHAWPMLPAGMIGLRSGPVMASTDAINITVHGRGAHAAYPDRGIDPIVAASHLVVALQTVVSRLTSPTEPAVVTIGSFHAGTARNVIPDQASLSGTLRTLSETKRKACRTAIRQVAEQTVAAFGARAEVDLVEGYPVNINNPGLTAFVAATASRVLGDACVAHDLPVSMGGEDCAYFEQLVPGCFFRLGIAPTDGSAGVASLHNAALDFNDEAIPAGVRVTCGLAWGWRTRQDA